MPICKVCDKESNADVCDDCAKIVMAHPCKKIDCIRWDIDWLQLPYRCHACIHITQIDQYKER